MPGRPIQHYVTQHILEHGGFEALIERIRQGETVAMIARTLFKPDGQAIHRTTLSHMLHARDNRSAQVGAAKAALDLGVPTYRFLRRYLDRRPPLSLTLRQVDPLIRQLTLYRDLIDQKTGDLP